jgi:general nucleoside transport system permease protein
VAAAPEGASEAARASPRSGRGGGALTSVGAAASPIRRRLPRGTRAVGYVGILLGLLAFYLALPPVVSRTPVVPIAVGFLAVSAGIWTVSRDERRLGWGAVAAGILGMAGGYLATRSTTGHLHQAVEWGVLIAATLRFATPLVYAAMGGILCERSGVVNIALEGMMLSGAFWGIWGADTTGSWLLGLLIAMASGAAMSLVHAFFAIHLRADQIVVGTALNFLALGITGYFFITVYGDRGVQTDVGIPDWPRLHFLDGIPWIGAFLDQAVGQLNLMIWLAFVLVLVMHVFIFRTPLGLRIRSVGEHPLAADTVGISVYATRYAAVVVSGMLAALGGAFLSVGDVHSFNQGMTNGRGFIALAAVIIGNWRPVAAFGAACLFGFCELLGQVKLPAAYGQHGNIPTLFQTLPYIVTLIVVAGLVGRSTPPAASGRPYKKQ